MVARRSAQTLAVLAALVESPTHWRHGYDIAKRTGLKSGTLYPILIRLAERGLLESSWEEEQPIGRPRRHLYRLTAAGVAEAAAAAPDAAPAKAAPTKTAPTNAAPTAAARVRPRLVGEGS